MGRGEMIYFCLVLLAANAGVFVAYAIWAARSWGDQRTWALYGTVISGLLLMYGWTVCQDAWRVAHP